MKQKIVTTLLNESVVTDMMSSPARTELPHNINAQSGWLFLKGTPTMNISFFPNEVADTVVTKTIDSMETGPLQIQQHIRGFTVSPRVFAPFEQATETTSHIVFISTKTCTYQSLPLIVEPFISEELPQDYISLPITLNKGDAFITEYNTDLSGGMGIYSEELDEFCVVYLETM